MNTSNELRIRSSDMPEQCDEIIKLRERFDKHLDSHREDYEEYVERQRTQEQFSTKNAEAIAALTEATQSLVDAWKTIGAIQKFVKWLSGFAFLGIIISWFAGFNPFK